MRLLQICNVGEICGGTAACAWTVTRSLLDFEHVVAFLGPISSPTRAAFAPCELQRWSSVTEQRIAGVRADFILLHNTSRDRVRGTWPVPTIQYAHSFTPLAAADVTVYCSRWLARRFGASEQSVCWQGVPRPPQRPRDGHPWASADVVIGRLCTPDWRKWPESIVPFYQALSRRCPFVTWEFVGCPRHLRQPLSKACGERAAFWEAGWDRRDRYWAWDALLYHHPTLAESFGRTAAEAMRAGCVPIVDRRGGFCEQLESGGGFLCGSLDEFAAAIERLRDVDVRRSLSRQAQHIADARWSLEAFGQRLMSRFDDARSVLAALIFEALGPRRLDGG